MQPELHPVSEKKPSVMKNQNFMALIGAQLVSNLGDSMNGLTSIWMMNLVTDGNPFWLAMVAVAQLLPKVLFGSFSGVLVDRWNALRTMRYCDLFAGSIVAVTAALAYTGSIAPLTLMLLTFLLSSATIFFIPSKQVLLTGIVKGEQLMQANSYSQTIQTVCMLGGPILAGLLIALIGPYLVFALDAATFFLSFLFLLAIRYQEEKKQAEKLDRKQFFKEFGEGVQVIKSVTVLRSVIPMALLLNFLFAPMHVFLTKMITDFYLGGARELSYLETAFGAGMLIGSISLGVFVKSFTKRAVFFTGLFGTGFTLMGLSLGSSVWLGAVMILLMGISTMLTNITFSTIVQHAVPREKLGRVFGLLTTGLLGGQPLSNVFFGLILGYFMVNHLILALAALVLILTLLLWVSKPIPKDL